MIITILIDISIYPKPLRMKKITSIVICLFICRIVMSQGLGFEIKSVDEYLHEQQKKVVVNNISGFCSAYVLTESYFSLAWNGCNDSIYSGTIEFEHVGNNKYNVYSFDENNVKYNDPSFGSYFACYDTDSQEGMANSDADNPSLHFVVSNFGELGYTGGSQWGEVYSVSNQEVNGSRINFNWTNDYGEGAAVELIREDGQLWSTLLAPCNICSESDSLALVALYDSTNGSSWDVPWDMNTPVRDWYGVILNDDCCVSELNLRDNNLVGQLPSEIANLSELEVLDIISNDVSGIVLDKVTTLTKLRILNIAGNRISGSIPNNIEDLINLEIAFLSYNQLEGTLPSSLANMKQLSFLHASNNLIQGEIPSSFGSFEQMRQVNLSANFLIGNITELGDIESLQLLALDFNGFTGEIPSSLANINYLQSLSLSYNHLEGVIPNGLTQLRDLRLNNNNLSGTIPEDITSIGKESFHLNLSHNNLTGRIRGDLITDETADVVDDLIGQSIFLNDNNFASCIENVDNLCKHINLVELDTVFIHDTFYTIQYEGGFNFSNNPKLPWEGNLQNACEGSEQIGAPCNDGNPDTENDGIDENCNCSENSVSTKEISQLESISINPNPVSSGERMTVSLVVNQGFDMTAQLIDITGKVITNKQITTIEGKNEFTLNLQSINGGLYFLQLSSEDGVTTQKVVVQ